MKASPVALVVLIVILPLALLGGVAGSMTQNQEELARQRVQQWLTQRLEDINGSLTRHFDKLARDLRRLTAIDDFEPEKLRQINRREPLFHQIFVVTHDGKLLYPNPESPLNRGETNFLLRTSQMFIDQDIRRAADSKVPKNAPESGTTPISPVVQETSRSHDLADRLVKEEIDHESTSGWLNWYWDRGENLIFWQRRPSGEIVGVALERARWIADVINELPEGRGLTPSSTQIQVEAPLPTTMQTRFRLVDAAAKDIYSWGELDSAASPTKPICEMPVVAPLSAWRLQCFVPEDQLAAFTKRGLSFGWLFGLVGMGMAMTLLGSLLLRSYARDMQEAAQQVSFVNQVSHELKTPLTNIRLYADLLDRQLADLSPDESMATREKLSVIVQEGDRLSRLITNVLTFARQQRRSLQPNLRGHDPRSLLEGIVARFRPSLLMEGIEVTLDLQASGPRLLDSDFVEQIVGNLISNVEKYAASGKRMILKSFDYDAELCIQVSDFGPGIPYNKREEIFRPFKRLDTRVSHVAGTGIGLSIARELARLHGGDIRWIPSPQGCTFEVRLNAPFDIANRKV